VMNPNVVPPGTFEERLQDRFAHALDRMAVPYKLNKKGEAVRSERTQSSLDTSTGIISTVQDLARFDGALLDDGALLKSETLARAWTNTRSSSGAALPTGLGWFVQTNEGQKIVWTFGVVDEGYSSLIVRIPARNITMIMLANSDDLGTQLSAGDVTASPFARVFLKLFP
jgi:CubicO group peptidase (beta-lactamase class C family)